MSAAEVEPILASLAAIVMGKEAPLRLCLACLIAGGHLLIEDIPGVGKTTLAHALAKSLGLSFQRIQFTSDLLPADVLGVSIYDRESGKFHFQPGPIFAQVVLADEVNRAPPKSQSALLEAMEEHQVTLDGKTMRLPEPFFVIATQNPQDQAGTFALPESQLDRFLMRIRLGFPDPQSERALWSGSDRRLMLQSMPAVFDAQRLSALQARLAHIHCAPALLDYVQALVAHTRSHDGFRHGVSPRAAIGLVQAARAWALIAGRTAVLPEDVQAVLEAVLEHRLSERGEYAFASKRLLEAVPIP